MIKLYFHILPWIKAIWDETAPVLENCQLLDFRGYKNLSQHFILSVWKAKQKMLNFY